MILATVHVDVNADNVRHHCSHAEGRSSYRLSGQHDDVTVYLNGTPDEVQRFAGTLADAAAAQAMREREAVS